MTSQQYQDTYVLVPRSSVSAPTKESKIQEAPQLVGTLPKIMTTSTSSSSSSTAGSATSNAKLESALSRISQTRNKGSGTSDAFTTRLCLVPAPGTWVNTASTATVYSTWASTVGCAEFADFASLFEQYRVVKITAQLWTGEINGARAVSGTSVSTGTQLLHCWFNSPIATSPTFDQLSDAKGAKYVDYLVAKNLHPLMHRPKGCYVDVGGGSYENSVGWQSTSKASNHVWGTYAFASRSQSVTASGIPFVVPLVFEVEFRKRRFLP